MRLASVSRGTNSTGVLVDWSIDAGRIDRFLHLRHEPGIAYAGSGIILLAEGAMQIYAFFSLRRLPGSKWLLIDGMITLLLGLMIGSVGLRRRHGRSVRWCGINCPI